MEEERKRILGLLAAGKITVGETEELLDALKRNGSADRPSESGKEKPEPRKSPSHMRVLVDSDDGDKVNVRIPMALLRAGIKLSSFMPKSASEQIKRKLSEHGVNIDQESWKASNVEEILESLADMNVDVNSADGNKVKVFFE